MCWSDTRTEGWRVWEFCLVPQIRSWIQVSQSPLWSSARVLFCRWYVPSAMKEEETLVLYLILAALGRIRSYFTTLFLRIAVAFNILHWMLSPPEFAKSNQKCNSDWETKDKGRKLGGEEGHQAFSFPHSSSTLSPFQNTCWVMLRGQLAVRSQDLGPLWMCLLQGPQSGACTETMSGATQLLPGALACLLCQKIQRSQSGALGQLGSGVRRERKCLVVRVSPAGASLQTWWCRELQFSSLWSFPAPRPVPTTNAQCIGVT